MKSRFQQVLEHKIGQREEATQDELGKGMAKDYASYREQVGYLRALADVLLLCEEAEREME